MWKKLYFGITYPPGDLIIHIIGRAWYFKFSYKDAFGATKQYRSKRYLTKKEASDAERMFLVTSTDKVEDNNMTLKTYMMSLECIMMK